MSLEEQYNKVVVGAVSGGAALLAWIVRHVFTNNKKIEMLEQKNDLQYMELKRSLARLEDSQEVLVKYFINKDNDDDKGKDR